MDKFYQACYTRVGGMERNSGWQLTNTSPDAPAKLLNAFEQRQKGNEPAGRDVPRNVSGGELCALELSCEADAVGFTRIQYGVPCYGREGSYSHGLLFPDAYELLKEPNRILALSEANFCFHGDRPEPEEALELYLSRTARIPSALEYGEGWTLEGALARCGMSSRTYKEFVCCLYGSWAKSARAAIYIQTDGTDEMAKAMMYLAYAALPYSMRPRLAASTFPDAKNVTMVLTHELPEGCRWFDPTNGMNNVLTPNQRKRWEKMPFVTMLFEEGEPPFQALEQQLDEMGDRYSQDTTTLQMACQMALEGGDADPVDQLYDFLNIPQDYNEMMERKAAQRLDEVSRIVNDQGMAMSDDMEQMLDQRLAAAQTETLRAAGVRYKSARISRMGLDEGCRYLEGNPAFDALRENLRHTESGLGMLTEYYRRKIVTVTVDPTCSYENLLDCAGMFCDLNSMGDLWILIFAAAKNIAAECCRRAMLGMRTGETGNADHTPIYLALQEYAGFARKVKELDRIPRLERTDIIAAVERDVSTAIEEWVKEYDKQFRRSFDAKRIREYELFYTVDFTKITHLRYGALLLQKYLAAREGALNVLLEFTEKNYVIEVFTSGGAGIRKSNRLAPEPHERDLIERSLYTYWADSEAVRRNSWMESADRDYKRDPKKKNLQRLQELDTQSFRFWERAARMLKVNMIWLMLEKDASLLLDEGVLEQSLALNERYWTDDRLSDLIGQCDASIRDGKSAAREIREILTDEQNRRRELLEERQKQAQKDKQERDKELKRMAKQEKKTEKQNAQEEKRNQKQNTQEEKRNQKQSSRTEQRDSQPGTDNKFTREEPGYVQVKPAAAKKADHNETDSVLDFLGTGHGQAAPDRGEDLAPPLPGLETSEKSGERGGIFGFFRKRKG